MFQWNCSEPVKNATTVYVPDIDFDHNDISSTSDASKEKLFIYHVKSLTCSGTVTGVEFCYRTSFANSSNTLYIMKELEGKFQITRIINVPFPDCTMNNGCCDMYTFPTADQFKLPSSDFSFGVLGSQFPCFPHLEYPYHLVFIAGLNLSVNSTVCVENNTLVSDRTLRILKLIVSK